MNPEKILIDGQWQNSDHEAEFHAEDPSSGEARTTSFPVSTWSDCDRALTAASRAAVELRQMKAADIAAFLDRYATAIDSHADELSKLANAETALAVKPRLREVELPRTTMQLREAAKAAREESWRRATIDTAKNIRSIFSPIGPVVVFGPNNFPFAFNGISGGDFAAAIAAGNPVIAKAHPLHPETSQRLAEIAQQAADESKMPAGTVQLLYHFNNQTARRLVSDLRVGAIGFTGSREAGLALQKAAVETCRPIYLELSSINPVILLPGILSQEFDRVAQEIVDSALAASGQFCTNPNVILTVEGADSQHLMETLASAYRDRLPQPLLSVGGLHHMEQGLAALEMAGARVLAGGKAVPGPGYRFENTLLHATGQAWIANPAALQQEVFGNLTTVITVRDKVELIQAVSALEGNLTGTIYASTDEDNSLYSQIEPVLRRRVGRLINNKMPTGVAVSPAMQHGGPFPSTSHPGFTSVGIPASMTRFAALECYDGVPEFRLPEILRDHYQNQSTWRLIDGRCTQAGIAGNP